MKCFWFGFSLVKSYLIRYKDASWNSMVFAHLCGQINFSKILRPALTSRLPDLKIGAAAILQMDMGLCQKGPMVGSKWWILTGDSSFCYGQIPPNSMTHPWLNIIIKYKGFWNNRVICDLWATGSARLSALAPWLQTHRQSPLTGNEHPLLQACHVVGTGNNSGHR